jgi:hypothetical protein
MSIQEYTVKVHDDGTRKWYQNGERHRVDGPAYEGASGTREWWLNGKLHRVDGPAYEGASGTREWWLNGKCLTEQQFLKQTKKPCAGKTVVIDGVTYQLTPV